MPYETLRERVERVVTASLGAAKPDLVEAVMGEVSEHRLQFAALEIMAATKAVEDARNPSVREAAERYLRSLLASKGSGHAV